MREIMLDSNKEIAKALELLKDVKEMNSEEFFMKYGGTNERAYCR